MYKRQVLDGVDLCPTESGWGFLRLGCPDAEKSWYEEIELGHVLMMGVFSVIVILGLVVRRQWLRRVAKGESSEEGLDELEEIDDSDRGESE